MKNLILTLAVLASIGASASENQSVFEIKEAQFSSSHVKNFKNGTVVVDYDEETVTLTTMSTFSCPSGMYCAQVMPAPKTIVLPIQSLEKDACGINHIVALKDSRPVDGSLQKITVDDASDISCKTLLEVPTRATYLTSFIDRLSGRTVSDESKMVLVKEGELEARTFKFAEGKFEKGYPFLQIPLGGSLSISDTEVEMTIYRKLNCPPGRNCPRYMPGPIVEKLPIIKIEKSFCGDRILAVADDGPNTADSIKRTIAITDYSHAKCGMMIRHTVEVTYTTEGGLAGLSSLAKFSFDKM